MPVPMTDGPLTPARAWTRVKWTRAAQLADHVDGLTEHSELLGVEPARAFEALRAHDPAIALMFAAQCLPRMDALQWMAACLSTTPPATPTQQAARAALTRWIRDPSDKLRRLAYVEGEASGWDTADGAACLAVFLSGGSLAPLEQEEPVPPAAGAFGQAVGTCVLMAALAAGPTSFDELLSQFLDLAAAMAAGEKLTVLPGTAA